MENEFKGKLVKLAIPIAFQQFMLALVSACDVCMLGGISQDSLSAVSLASQITFVFNLIMAALMIGENMFVAQYYGKEDFTGVQMSAGLVLKYVLMASMIFLIVTVVAPEGLMRLFTDQAELIYCGSRYLRIIGLSYVFSGILQALQGLLKNCGYVGKSTLISMVVVGINIFLNAILIYGWLGMPRLEIAGAALATVIANGIGLAMAVSILLPEKNIRITIRSLTEKSSEFIRRFWTHVFPVFMNELVWGIGFTMYSVILGHLGSDAVAANSIVNITKNLLICVCTGSGYGGSIIIGNLLGEGKLAQAKQTGNYLCKISVVAGIFTGLTILILAPGIVHFANLTHTAARYLKWMLIMSSYYVIGKSINSMTIGGIFPAGGDTRFGLKCDVITMWCFAVPVGFLAAFVLRLPVLAVYFTLNLDEIVKLPAVFRHYRQYRWVNNLTEKENETWT